MLQISYVALRSGPLPSLFRKRSLGPRWPSARGPSFEPFNYIGKIWYVALSGGPLPS